MAKKSPNERKIKAAEMLSNMLKADVPTPTEKVMEFFSRSLRVSSMIENYFPDFKYGGRVALVRCIENIIPYDKEAEESWGLVKVCFVFTTSKYKSAYLYLFIIWN